MDPAGTTANLRGPGAPPQPGPDFHQQSPIPEPLPEFPPVAHPVPSTRECDPRSTDRWPTRPAVRDGARALLQAERYPDCVPEHDVVEVFPQYDAEVVYGGQPYYNYIVSVE